MLVEEKRLLLFVAYVASLLVARKNANASVTHLPREIGINANCPPGIVMYVRFSPPNPINIKNTFPVPVVVEES